ncbi:MAG: hypothetical protein KAI79_06675 [Bacteroidales bacterium]|nr:hypothetical protein [Bacteroidales bacterium]
MKEIFELFIVSGTVGAYAMLSVILLIVGYFKYLLPYLKDFNDIKEYLSTLPSTYRIQQSKLKEISELTKDISEKDKNYYDKYFSNIRISNEKTQTLMINEIGKIKYLLEDVIKKDDKISSNVSDSFNELMIEIIKLQTRLEYMPSTMPGGIRK